MAPDATEITLLLQRWRTGDLESESRIFELLLPELRAIAAHYLRRERQGHSLQPTVLVNEAFLRLTTARDVDWKDRGHFLALAARMMRRYLIDRARMRPAAQFVPWDEIPEFKLNNHTKLETVLAVDTLLDELEKQSPQKRMIVELKFFLGLTDIEAAEALHLTLRTLQREWHGARQWLYDQLGAAP
jgi:RNA polymerase sigma factor (TIGR02999 family)